MSLAAIVVAAVAAAATSLHFPVSTSEPRAQAAVDRGLFLYYAYDGEAAARSFERAAAFDPRLGMAYWGIALGNGPDLNTPMTAPRFAAGARAIGRAVALSSGASPEERRFIAAMALRYRGAFGDLQRDDEAYRNAMLQLARESNDENARLLAAEALLEAGGLAWQADKLANEPSREALELVNGVLRDDPASAMANHLCIHLYDLATDRAPAFACARRLDAARFPREAEHLAHMPAHYWIETGNYAAAMASSDRAYELLAGGGGGTAPVEGRYAKHDVAVGYSAAMMLGSYAAAQRWSQRMDGVFDQSFAGITALRFGRYAEAYAAGSDGFGGASVRGLAALQLGNVAEGHAIAARLSPAETKRGYLPQLFLARLAEADGRNEESRQWLRRAADDERADFSGETIPLVPAGEALGDFYLRIGDSARAAAAFTGALAAYANDPRALFGLTKALRAQGRGTQALATRTRFDEEWRSADTDAAEALP